MCWYIFVDLMSNQVSGPYLLKEIISSYALVIPYSFE